MKTKKTPPPRTSPKPDELATAPELAVLAVLDAVISIAELQLLVENPQLADPQAASDPLVVALLDDLSATARSLDNYLRYTRALAAEAQRDLPF